jgi:hypothetical protein
MIGPTAAATAATPVPINAIMIINVSPNISGMYPRNEGNPAMIIVQKLLKEDILSCKFVTLSE